MIHTSRYSSPIGILTLAAQNGALIGLWFDGQKYYGAALSLPPMKAETAGQQNKLCTAVTMYNESEAYTLCAPSDAYAGDDAAILARARDWLDCYFGCGKPSPLGLPLAPQGTAYQRAVWSLLCGIPYGQLISYGELAHRLGKETSPRAVGSAVGRNPISLIIPCHRVVGANGQLTGYAGGLERKRWLLIHECAITADA